MKAFLMYRDQDVDLQRKLPWNEGALTQDLEVETLFGAMALMTSASVSLGGTIGFIGLLMPHIVRFLLGADSRLLVPASAAAGGAFLCFADLLGRSLMPPLELPSGTVTAVIGAPYFLYLLRKKDVLTL